MYVFTASPDSSCLDWSGFYTQNAKEPTDMYYEVS